MNWIHVTNQLCVYPNILIAKYGFCLFFWIARKLKKKKRKKEAMGSKQTIVRNDIDHIYLSIYLSVDLSFKNYKLYILYDSVLTLA